jgi:hypothetical protein
MERFKFLSDKLHGILDYGVVIIFALAPSWLGIVDTAAWLCYALAAIHLVMTFFTDMPLGAVKIIPIKLHGTIELLVGLALIVAAWTVASLISGQLFFTLMGAIIFFVWVSSNYGDTATKVVTPSPTSH